MAKEKTIEELWGNLQKEEAKSANHWKRFEKTQSDSALIWHTKAKADVLILRQHLLERCSELVDCADGHFSINQKLILRISHGEINAFKEGAAILSFWAWELEQRQKEQQNGN